MRLSIVALGALLLVAAMPAAPAATTTVTYELYHVSVDGETAEGDLAYPASGAPTTLLVFGHGCCGQPNQSAFVKAYAQAYGVVVVAMKYRGHGGWDVQKGHEDLIAATVDLKARFPTIARTVLWGISMGGETTGMAVAARPDLYEYWVDTFGVTNLFEEYATLGLYPGPWVDGNHEVHSWMMDETGGTPAEVPQAYADRSPALHTDAMLGIRRAYVVHGVGDPVVPYSMSRETFEGLVAHGVPASFYTVTTGWGGVQGPWTPAGWYGVPLCNGTVGACVPPGACNGTPAGTVCLVGPAAHDGRGSGPAYAIVDQLLRGLEPDAGTPFAEHVVDSTAGKQV